MITRNKFPILLAAAILGIATILPARDTGSPIPAPATQQQSWSSGQLDNLVAPIALYSDPLVSQMLVASTYPLEVVEANQWLERNAGLQGQPLMDAARQQPWDPSIQALVAVPDALETLGQDIRWTTDLGDAFLAQQDDVMNAIQRMRIRAQADGRLYSTTQQIVRSEDREGSQVIEILPASPDILYVPVYDPVYIWGPPVYGYYPPLDYPYFGFSFGSGYNLAFCFGDWGGWTDWGWGFDWHDRRVVVDNVFFHRYGFRDRYRSRDAGRTVWTHDPDHRLRVPYSDSRVAGRFGGAVRGVRNSSRAIPAGREAGIPGRSQDRNFRGRTPQESRYRSRTQPRYQAPLLNSNSADRYRGGPRVVPLGQQGQSNRMAPRADRSESRTYRQRPRTGILGDSGNRALQNRRNERSSIQIFRTPSAQRYEAPRVLRSNSASSRQRFEGNSGFRNNGGPRMSRGGGSHRNGGRRR